MSTAGDRSLLVRLLEPEVMDSADDARDYDAMDHGDVNRRFVADFLEAQRAAGVAPNAELLDVGTGTALIPIELCRQDHLARVRAIDLADHMLLLARKNVERQQMMDRITLERIDAKGLPYADSQFPAVISNSIVHHIPEPRGVLAEAIRVLAPGGLAFIRDLARPQDDEQVRRLVDMYAAGCNPHQRQLFEDSLRAALSVDEIRSLVAELGFPANTVHATSDRHWTWIAVKE